MAPKVKPLKTTEEAKAPGLSLLTSLFKRRGEDNRKELDHCKEEARTSTKANVNRASPDSQEASTVFQRATTCSSCKDEAEKDQLEHGEKQSKAHSSHC
jgi:hypothetical protein